MIEDMQHLTVIDGLMHEIQVLINQYNGEANGVTDKATLVALRLREIDALTELLRQHKRALRHMVGEPVEPEAHRAEAVLIGIGAGAVG